MFEISLFISSELWSYPAFDNARLKVTNIHFIDDLLKEIHRPFDIFGTNFRFNSFLKSIRNVLIIQKYLALQPRIDIFHITNGLFIDLILAAKLKGYRSIIGTFRLLPKGSYTTPNVHRKLWFPRMIVHQLDQITFPSEICKTKWSEVFNIPNEKTSVINNGVECSLLPPTPKTTHLAKQLLGNNPTQLVIIVVATLAKHKGHQTLLEALSILKNEGFSPFPKTYIIGNGPLYERLLEKAKIYGIKENVQFIGFCDDVKPFYQAADLMVLPTLYESFGNVLLEAMAEGKPVIASNTGGVPEIVLDGETGILVPPGDSTALANAIRELCSDEQKRTSIGKAGWKRAFTHFSIQAMVRGTESVYLRALENCGKIKPFDENPSPRP